MTQGGQHSRRALLCLACLAFLICAARLYTRDEPLERDITTYAVIAHELLQGRNLYSDLWDIKPPAVFVTYAAAEAVFGYGPRSVTVLAVIASLLALLGVHCAASAGGRSREGLWAAAAFAIVSGDLALEANQPNGELFLNVGLVWLLTLLLRARGPLGLRGAAAAGSLLFIVSAFKPYAAIAALLLAAYALVPSRETLRGTRLREVSLSAAVAVGGWLGILAWFGASGRASDLYEVLFVYGRHYAGDLAGNVVNGFFERTASLLALAAILALALVACSFGRRARRRTWLLLAVYAVAIHLMVCLPGKSFPHYLQLWLPLLAVAFGSLVGLIRDIGEVGRAGLAPRRGLLGADAFGGLVVAGLLAWQLPSYTLSPEQWSQRKYGEIFVLVRALAQDLSALLQPGETFLQVGAESGLYFYTRQSPPTGPLIARHYLEGPLREKLQARILRDLERNPPELVVVMRSLLGVSSTSRAQEPLLRWLLARYRWPAEDAAAATCFPRLYERLAGRENPFLFLLRSDGAVEARLFAQLAWASPAPHADAVVQRR